MVREQLAEYRDLLRQRLVAAFREEHTPHQVAASFAIGVFITSLPTGGIGVGLFFVLVSIQAWISKPAIFASVAVLNPFVKPAVYVGSFHVGAVLLGSESVASREAVTGESSLMAIQQLLFGNLVIAVVLSALGYIIVLHLTRVHRSRSNQRIGSTLLSGIFGPFRRQ